MFQGKCGSKQKEKRISKGNDSSLCEPLSGVSYLGTGSSHMFGSSQAHILGKF